MKLVVTSLEKAKYIFDITLGPHHLSSLKIGHSLPVAHTKLGRFGQALEIEEKAIEDLKDLLEASDPFLEEADEYLSRLKERVTKSRTGASPDSKDDEVLAEKIAQCGISDEENRI